MSTLCVAVFKQVEAVRRVEVPGRRPALIGVAVLPDDSMGPDADDDDAVAVVVVDRDQPGAIRSGSDGWSSAPGPERGPYRQSTRPVRVMMIACPGRA